MGGDYSRVGYPCHVAEGKRLIIKPRVYQLATIAVVLTMTLVGPAAHADELLGVSACTFLPAPPLDRHPARRGPFRAAFVAKARAGRDSKKNEEALASFVRIAEGLLAEGARAFGVKGEDPMEFEVSSAQRFLSRFVLTPNAPLRVGRDGFELVPEVTATAMLAGCLGLNATSAVAMARRSTGAEAGAARAGAALLVLFQGAGTHDDAVALVAGLAPEDFLSAFVLAEVASRGQEAEGAWVAHAIAASLVKTADQHEAVMRQKQRLPERP